MERAGKPFRRRGAVSPRRPVNRAGAAGITLLVVLASLLAYARAGQESRGPYDLADDCPRGALVYAQVADLPELLRLWDGSALKEQYLASTNFRQFRDGLVALKLVERGREFGNALGFTLDAAVLAQAAERKAALAVYDIGRLEMLFVARVGEEKALAARFFQDTGQLVETELPDGTVFYGGDVEADRGRRRQKILFAFLKGRFVLATGEQLMLRTLANINGRSRADRLSDEPSFRTLSGAVVPHFASVWVDQSRLNDDYYFKQYWAMGDVARLKEIRAGIFDFEMREGSWLERREYLVEPGRRPRGAGVSRQDMQELRGTLPADATYVRVRALEGGAEDAAALVGSALLDHTPEVEAGGPRGRLHEDFDPLAEGGADDYWDHDYLYLDDDYDEAIDEPDDDGQAGQSRGRTESRKKALAVLGRVLGRGRPLLSASAVSPQAFDGPLFVEFRRLAVVRLEDPGAIDRQALESAIASLAAGRLTVAGAAAGLTWADGGEGERRRRELELPMLGWGLCYALKGRELYVANDAAFLDAALAGGGGPAESRGAGARFTPDDLTVIRLDHKDRAFDPVFEKLDAPRVRDYWERRGAGAANGREAASQEFFSGNVASLLGVASATGRVEIRRRTSPGRLQVEVEMSMSADAKATDAR